MFKVYRYLENELVFIFDNIISITNISYLRTILHFPKYEMTTIQTSEQLISPHYLITIVTLYTNTHSSTQHAYFTVQSQPSFFSSIPSYTQRKKKHNIINSIVLKLNCELWVSLMVNYFFFYFFIFYVCHKGYSQHLKKRLVLIITKVFQQTR